MTVTIYLSLIVVVSQGVAPVAESQLITSPPRLEVESNRVVWYQIPNSGPVDKFELKCQAKGDSVEYSWLKDGQHFQLDNERMIWQRAGQSGTIVFLHPKISDQGFYQCRAANIFGVALSNIFEVRLGTLDHFQNQQLIKEIRVKQGEKLTLPCTGPRGVPKPTMFWLFRNTKQSFVIETIDREHITVDGDGNLQFSHVENHDGRENLVYQCAATSAVLHGEYRTGDEVQLSVEDAPLVETAPEIMWVSPEKVKVTAGDTMKLTCIFSGYPTPQIKWTKKYQQLPTERILLENFGRTLVIRPAYQKDEGVYECQAGNIVHKMVVEVSSAPQWKTGPPLNFDLAEDDDVELICDAIGEPKPQISWFKNGIPIDENLIVEQRHRISDDGSRLKINKLEHTLDKAVYQCNASSNLGYVFANAYVNVQAFPPKLLTPAYEVVKAIVGTWAALECQVDAAPKANIKWTDSNNNLVVEEPGKKELLFNGTLRIHNLRIHDAETYICNVDNKFGVNLAKKVLEIYKPTYFALLLHPSDQLLIAGDQIDMTCLAESDERLKLEYIWTRDGHKLDSDSLTFGSKFIQPNRLLLKNLKGRDSGIYKCTVKTLVDEISTKMKLRVRDVPDSPIITRVKCRETQALISWTTAYDNNDNINEYIIEYANELEADTWKPGLAQKSREGNAVYEAAVGLNPWVNYTFRVVAVNSIGKGPPGYMSHVTCRTPPAVPYLNPKNVVTEATRKDNMIIKWEPLLKEQWAAPNLSYVVQYMMENSNEDWRSILIENADQNYIEIEGLPTYQKFRVQVRSKNEKGLCPSESQSVFGFSGEDVPLHAPEEFKNINVNATRVTFTWRHMEEKELRGKLSAYYIRVWESKYTKSKRFANFLWDLKVAPENNVATVENLKPMKSYAANILVANTKFNSTTSSTIKFTTPEGPPGPVSNLEVESYGAHTILCTWTPPEENLGNISAYRIEFYEENENGVAKNVYDSAVGAGTLHHVHDTLKPSTLYTVLVWAVTGGGPGSKLKRRVKTFSRQNPGQPEFDIQSFEPKSVIVKWIPSKLRLPGTSFYVNYTVDERSSDSKDVTLWKKTESVFLPDFYLTIGNLTPDVEYKFIMYVNDGSFSTASDIKRFKTLSLYSYQRSTSQDTIAGASWFIATMSALCIFVLTTITVCLVKANKGEKYPVKKKELERGHSFDNDEEKSFMEYQYGATSSRSSETTADS